MSAFADTYRGYMADCADAIDDLMGERVILTPTIRRPNYQPEPETSKAVEVIAVFTWVSEMSLGGSGKGKTYGSGGTDFVLPVQSRKPLFSFKANYLPFPIQRGFRIQRCVDASLWDVTDVKPDGVSRIAVDVVQLGLAAQ
ncbi:hypothetical protein V1281_002640 [Nitrobacteraceae bacterium AZCC 2161]